MPVVGGDAGGRHGGFSLNTHGQFKECGSEFALGKFPGQRGEDGIHAPRETGEQVLCPSGGGALGQDLSDHLSDDAVRFLADRFFIGG